MPSSQYYLPEKTVNLPPLQILVFSSIEKARQVERSKFRVAGRCKLRGISRRPLHPEHIFYWFKGLTADVCKLPPHRKSVGLGLSTGLCWFKRAWSNTAAISLSEQQAMSIRLHLLSNCAKTRISTPPYRR
jgi:hypothetical protein